MSMRTLYLQRMLSINGRGALAGRALYDRFDNLSEETLLGHTVWDDETSARIKDLEIKNDIISHSLFHDFQPNIIYIEGGLFYDSEGNWKIPKNIVREFCRRGGVLIVADVDINELSRHKSAYSAAFDLFGVRARYGHDGDGDPIYGSDESRCWKGHRQIRCIPDKMIISDWIKPIYEGIPEILVGIPGCLSYNDAIIASCNSDTTGILHLDSWVDQHHPCPFASATQIGSGFAVLISGNVSSDVWLQGCKYNTAWLTNICTFLAGHSAEDASRRRSHRRSPHLLFLSHRSIDKPFVSKVSESIKSQGVNVWIDEEQLIPSQSLTEEISSALGKMTHFVIFWSIDCVDAPWVKRELNSAISILIERSMPLIIVRLDSTPVPPILTDILRIEAAGTASKLVGNSIVEAVKRLELS